VPISDTSCPLKKSWKLRCRSARTAARQRDPLAGVGFVTAGDAGSLTEMFDSLKIFLDDAFLDEERSSL
jgi:hypothetical protein